MWAVALAAFLVRGGILVLAVPILILPTPIGVASFIGADAVTAAGPTDRFLVMAAAAGLALAAAVGAGFVVGAVADRVVLRAWAFDRPVAAPSFAEGRRSGAAAGVARVIAVRVVASIPLVVACAWAIPRIATAGYRELTLPDDLATPFPLRVLAAAPEAAVAIVAGLLVTELIAGLATVHVVVDGSSVPRSLGRVAPDLVRRPLPVLGAFLLGVTGLVVLTGIPLAVSALAWGAARRALTAGDAVFALLAVVALSATWIASLAAAGAVGAWRRAALASALARPRAEASAVPAGRVSVAAD